MNIYVNPFSREWEPNAPPQAIDRFKPPSLYRVDLKRC